MKKILFFALGFFISTSFFAFFNVFFAEASFTFQYTVRDNQCCDRLSTRMSASNGASVAWQDSFLGPTSLEAVDVQLVKNAAQTETLTLHVYEGALSGSTRGTSVGTATFSGSVYTNSSNNIPSVLNNGANATSFVFSPALELDGGTVYTFFVTTDGALARVSFYGSGQVGVIGQISGDPGERCIYPQYYASSSAVVLGVPDRVTNPCMFIQYTYTPLTSGSSSTTYIPIIYNEIMNATTTCDGSVCVTNTEPTVFSQVEFYAMLLFFGVVVFSAWFFAMIYYFKRKTQL